MGAIFEAHWNSKRVDDDDWVDLSSSTKALVMSLGARFAFIAYSSEKGTPRY